MNYYKYIKRGYAYWPITDWFSLLGVLTAVEIIRANGATCANPHLWR